VIASSEALEGLTVIPEVHVGRADTPEQWIAAITELLQSPDEVARFATAGRQFTEQHHDWETLMSDFGRLLDLPDRTGAVKPTAADPSCTSCER